jgi:hypothetical protein
VGKPIRLAAAADVATVRAAGCEPPVPEAELLTANIDDHALTATYRYVPRDSGNPDLDGRAIVAGCTARWNRAEAGWEKTSCGHYAPAWTRRAIARSGGGMIPCPELSECTADAPMLIWVAPPRDARWLVVRRSRGYAIAYRVVGRRPVRLVYGHRDALPFADGNASAFPYLAIDAEGGKRRLTAIGAVAG